jgi:hypothetical protein
VVADGFGVSKALQEKKVELVRAGERIAELMADGYQPITF